MGQVTRCPLVGTRCAKPITVQSKAFFLAEAEEPDYDRRHRKEALGLAIVDGFALRSALDEKGINAFSCKICEMIQTCAYGIADITQKNPNVLLELGMMIALGKPTIILLKKEQSKEIDLFSDLKALEVIPFEEYLDIIEPLRAVVTNLPPSVSLPSPIEDIEKLRPQFAEELKKLEADIVKEFREGIPEAKLDAISFGEEKKEIPRGLDGRLSRLEEKLEDIMRLGFAPDVETALLRGNYFFNKGKYEEAITAYTWSLELRPGYLVALVRRGVAYINLGRFEESLADFNYCLQIKPDDPVTLGGRGIAYGGLERYHEALDDFNHSLEIEPDNTLALGGRGIVYFELGRYEESLTDLNHCLEIEPDKPKTLYNLACLFSLWGKTDDALSYLEKAIDKDKKYREKAKTDKDFDNIRDDPRFKKLTESE